VAPKVSWRCAPSVITFETMRDYAVQFGVTIEEREWAIVANSANAGATKQLTRVECTGQIDE
jgi:hypothetical protein